MLQAIRDRVTGIVAIFVLGLLAVPFLFFGLESYMRAVPQDAVAVVGDAEISNSEFQTSFARYRAQLRQQQGDSYNDVVTNQPAARREHLEGMIDQLLLRQYAADMGLTISDRQIAETIREVPNFQIDGQFNPDVYLQALRAAGETPRSFERSLRDDMQTRLLPNALADSAIVTEAEVDRMIRLQQQTRALVLLEASAEQFVDSIAISDEQISAYYNDNLAAFTTEERVRLAYVELVPEELLDEAPLSEEEIQQRYDAARQRYLTPEGRRASHILIENGAEAQSLAAQLHERIENGESFEDLAVENSADFASAEQGGDLGWIEPGDMIEGFEDALYALAEPGDLSEPVETRFGWHLIRLDEVRPPEGMSLEEASVEILEEHLERQREALYLEMSERMVDLVYADDSSLELLSDELGLEVRESDWFTRAGTNSGIAADAQVIDAAFSDLVLLDRAIADPIELERNHMVAIKILEHEPAEPRPLAEVSEEISEHLLAEAAAELAREQAQSWYERVVEGDESLEGLAEAEEVELVSLDSLGRNDFQHGPDFVTAVFQLTNPGDTPSLHVLPRQGGYALVRLESVQAGDPAAASEFERDMMRRQLQFTRMNEEFGGLLASLRETTKISVVEDRLR